MKRRPPPGTVIQHRHYFFDEDSETFRVDACLMEDGRAFCWIVDHDFWFEVIDYESAESVAEMLTNIHRAALVTDPLVAALMVLARMGIPSDVQELLVSGDPSRGIAPNALRLAIAAAIRAPARNDSVL